MATGSWDGQDHHMPTASDDDFHAFMDMAGMGEGIQFDFNGFQDNTVQPQPMMRRRREPADAIMSDAANDSIMAQVSGIIHNHAVSINSVPLQMTPTSAPNSDSICNIDAQIQYLQQQKFEQQQRQQQEQRQAFYLNHNHSVPPTPQSFEMPPGSGPLYTHSDQISHYDRAYRRQRIQEQQDMAFTPLVSPACTPLDPIFKMDNTFNVPSAFFSPLTSPALLAQNDPSPIYDYASQSHSNSPVEMDTETSRSFTSAPTEMAKRTRKNGVTKMRSKPSIRNSPISKPQRRKAGPSPAIVSQVLNEHEEWSSSSHLLPLPAASPDRSGEDASVSPENLDMPPPPVPTRRSTSKSPYIQAQNEEPGTFNPSAKSAENSKSIQVATTDLLHPATPASLMRFPASKTKKLETFVQEQASPDNIESLELPSPISKKQFALIEAQPNPKKSPRIDTNLAKGASFQTLPSPVLTHPSSTTNRSPRIYPGSSGPAARKTPLIAPRGGRKGSIQSSPALLPRISPSIKPMIPGAPGLSAAEVTASQLLMSKSNYQNILEGNMVPGVSYPSELSTNLTSKRTSHKLAEQGRRNRINSAIQVMAGLLPDGQSGSGEEEGDKKDSKQANAANSKASVVENAITHLKNLTQENDGLKKEIQELRSRLEKIKSSV